jgi:hypothetical protein
MFDRSDETSPVPPRRIEVFTKPERRRDWPDETKIAIVAESLAPGVNISAVGAATGSTLSSSSAGASAFVTKRQL